jgi:hypothetical protein
MLPIYPIIVAAQLLVGYCGWNYGDLVEKCGWLGSSCPDILLSVDILIKSAGHIPANGKHACTLVLA